MRERKEIVSVGRRGNMKGWGGAKVGERNEVMGKWGLQKTGSWGEGKQIEGRGNR